MFIGKNMQNTKQKESKNQDLPIHCAPGWLGRMDSRLALVKFLESRFLAITEDLGGQDCLSTMQRGLIERMLFLEYWLHTQETELLTGKDFNAGSWIQGFNALSGVCSKLGLERRAKQVPSLREVIDRHQEAIL